MEWLNIRVATLRAPEYIGSDPTERATWLNVLAFCAHSENGGRIVDAAAWKDRQWQQTCGVTLKEARECPRLLQWNGDDVIVWNYPLDKELEVISKREGGGKGARSRWAKAKASASSSPDSSAIATPTSSGNSSVDSSAINRAPDSAYTEGEGEWNGSTLPPLKGQGAESLSAEEALTRLYTIFKRDRTRKLGYESEFAFSHLMPISEPDLAAVEWFYARQHDPKSNALASRHRSLEKLIQNFGKAVDEARDFAKKNGGGPGFLAEKKERPAPAGWQAWHAKKWPDKTVPPEFSALPPYVQDEARRELGGAA